MNGILQIDNKTKYWLLLAERGRWHTATAKLRFKIREVTLGVCTRQTTIASFQRGKVLTSIGHPDKYFKEYSDRVASVTKNFHKLFKPNQLWINDIETVYIGFFENKEFAEKHLVENGLLDKAIKDSQLSLEKQKQKCFSIIKELTALTAEKERLTGIKTTE